MRQRFEQWSANPRCEANVLSAVSNVRMDRVAERQGVPPSMGQSPFAIAAGNTFEFVIFRESAKRLREQSRENNHLVDCTMGRKMRSMVLTDSQFIFMSAMRPEALMQRMEKPSTAEESIADGDD